MTKILAGVCLALLVALGLTANQALRANRESAETRQALAQARQALTEQAQQAQQVLDRLDRFDRALVNLDGVQRGIQDGLQANLRALQTITKTEGDSDESIECLGVRVPTGVDQRLR